MSDDRRAQSPTPVLRTRPATMLTAIGLCVFIMVMQLLPEFRDSGLDPHRPPRPRTSRRSISPYSGACAPARERASRSQVARAHMSSDNVQALPPGTRLGDYRLDAVIGHGGFGITYRAFDTQLAKFVAIKEYLPVEFAVRRRRRPGRAARHALRRRFRLGPRALPRRGARARPLPPSAHRAGAALLRGQRHGLHRHGVRGRQERRRAPARSRPAACRPTRCGAWPTGWWAASSAVHAQGFLHRDIKPSNIIVRRDGVPVLIDFGAARQAMGERTRTLTGMLTPQYAPIEQYALDGKQGPWSDIYSAAAVLHHAIAGAAAARCRRAASATIPTGRWRRRMPIASSRPSWRRSIARWPSRRPSGRRPSRNGRPCSACRSRASPMRRRNASPVRSRPHRRGWAAPAATPMSRRRRRRRRRADRARRSGSCLLIVVIGGAAAWRYQAADSQALLAAHRRRAGRDGHAACAGTDAASAAAFATGADARRTDSPLRRRRRRRGRRLRRRPTRRRRRR